MCGLSLVAVIRSYPLVVMGRLTVVASPVVDHRSRRGVSSCGAGAWWPCGMWSLPRPEIEPVSSARQVDS